MQESLTLAFILQCCTMLICMMLCEYEGIWKEAVVAQWK